MRSSGAPPEFYVDRSLGQVGIPHVLRELGLVVHTEREIFGEVPAGVADEEWLERAGVEGWIVLTKDTRIRYRSAELEQLVLHRVKAFVMASGSLSLQEQSLRIVRTVHRILQACRKTGPFVYVIHAQTIERVWPRQET